MVNLPEHADTEAFPVPSGNLPPANPDPHLPKHPASTTSKGESDVLASPHYYSATTLASHLTTSQSTGLTHTEAAQRLLRDGYNELGNDSKWGWVKVLWRQIANALTLILVAAMIVAFATGDYPEGGVVAGVIIVNVGIGFIQELKAENMMDSLKQMSSPTALVVRNGTPGASANVLDTNRTRTSSSASSQLSTLISSPGTMAPSPSNAGASQIHDVDHLLTLAQTIPTRDLVVGDLVILKTGSLVPADVRLTACIALDIEEASLTGESVPVTKNSTVISRPNLEGGGEIPLGERANCAFASTVIARGRGAGVVYATGKATQIGVIADLMKNGGGENAKGEGWNWARFKKLARGALGLNGSSLQVKMTKLAHSLFCIAVVLVIVVFAVSKFKIDSQTLIYAISLSIAIIPEALPAVITVCMSVGSSRLAKRKAVVRRLDCLEALGGVEWICSDKTGTLTLGKMTATSVWTQAEGHLTVGNPTSTDGTFSRRLEALRGNSTTDGTKVSEGSGLERLLECASLCNSATTLEGDDGVWKTVGDPTEVALQQFAFAHNFVKQERLATLQRVSEHPFDSTVKSMTSIFNTEDGECLILMKGAAERVMAATDMTQEECGMVLNEVEGLASQGLRVLALASKIDSAKSNVNYKAATRDQVNQDLTFLGLVGIMDPPRPESKAAVEACHRGNIGVSMCTGDHVLTAVNIARAVGILRPTDPESAITTGPAFDRMTEAEIDALPTLPVVIARCSPASKVAMINALHRRGLVSAMTGDGTNDAPALRRADIGIAMGSGSDVARGASEITLVNDDFSTVTSAVEQGRRIFDNLIKFMLHLLSSNTAEVIVLVCGLGFLDSAGSPVYPLSPITVLLENLLTSALPSIGLSFEDGSEGLMSRPPRKHIFTKEFVLDTLVYGMGMGIGPLLSWCIVIYAAEGGLLGLPGSDCNEDIHDPGCGPAFRARSAVFVSLSLSILLHAFTCKDSRRSLFSYKLRDYTKNRFLFWSVFGGIALIPPCIYIPGLNTTILKQAPITWEWGVSIGATAIYLIVAEGWKVAKRHWIFKSDTTAVTTDQIEDVEQGSDSKIKA